MASGESPGRQIINSGEDKKFWGIDQSLHIAKMRLVWSFTRFGIMVLGNYGPLTCMDFAVNTPPPNTRRNRSVRPRAFRTYLLNDRWWSRTCLRFQAKPSAWYAAENFI